MACDEKRETSLRRREMRKSTIACFGVWGSTREAPVALPRRACGPALEPQAKHLGKPIRVRKSVRPGVDKAMVFRVAYVEPPSPNVR